MEEQTNIQEEIQEQKKSNTLLIAIGIVVALIAIAVAVLTYHQFFTKPLLQENEELKELEEEIPAGRMGKTAEVAELVVKISQSPSYMTGQIIKIDGGWI